MNTIVEDLGNRRKLYVKLQELQRRLPIIPKSATNPHFKSRYADFPTIMEVVKPLLVEIGLVYLQPLCVSDNPAILKIDNIIIDPDTGYAFNATSTVPIGNNLTPQAYGSAVTYARRYSMASFLNLVVDDDDDGNAASMEPKVSKVVANQLSDIAKSKGINVLQEINARKRTSYKSVYDLPQSLAAAALAHYSKEAE